MHFNEKPFFSLRINIFFKTHCCVHNMVIIGENTQANNMIMTGEPAFCHISLLLISFVVSKGSDVNFASFWFEQKFKENSFEMKLLWVLCLISCVKNEPQLDLPRVQSTTPRDNSEGPEVLILPNSYTDEKEDVQKKSDSNYRFESDRNSRLENDQNRRFESDRSNRYGAKKIKWLLGFVHILRHMSFLSQKVKQRLKIVQRIV